MMICSETQEAVANTVRSFAQERTEPKSQTFADADD